MAENDFLPDFSQYYAEKKRLLQTIQAPAALCCKTALHNEKPQANGTHFVAERAKRFGFLVDTESRPKALAASATTVPRKINYHWAAGII